MRSRDELRQGQLDLIDDIKLESEHIGVLGMGGGKTVSMLTAFLDNQVDGFVDKMLVLAPPLVVENAWPNEPAKWEHLQDMKVVPVVGTPKQREKLILGDGDVFVVSHNNVKWLVELLIALGWDLSRWSLVIDELSRFKSATGKWGAKMLKISDQFESVWGLTGTPRPGGWEDLFMPLRIIAGKDVWGTGNFDEWRRQHFMPMDYNHYNWQVHDFAVPIFEEIVAPYITTYEFKVDKPTLHTGDDFIRWVELWDDQRKHYEEMMKHLVIEILGQDQEWSEEHESRIIAAMSQGVKAGKLAQIVQGTVYDDGQSVHRFKVNPKLRALEQLLNEIGGDKAIIVYGLRDEIHMVKDVLHKNEIVGVLGRDGGTDDLKHAVEGGIDRLLMHPAAASHGIDGLQDHFHHIVWLHPSWSYEQTSQSIARIDRPGQQHDVFNWQIMARDTIDEIKLARVESSASEEAAFKALFERNKKVWARERR